MFDFHHHHPNNRNGIYQSDISMGIPQAAFSVGLHPKSCSKQWEKEFEKIIDCGKHPNCWAIGECGLDVFSKTPLALQKTIFEQHILLANRLQKPVVIHCVRLHSDLISFAKKTETALIIHGFHKKYSVAEFLLKQGFYLSFGQALLKNESLQNTFKQTDNSRFFLETDTSQTPISEIYKKASELKTFDVENQINSNLKQMGIARKQIEQID